MNKRIWSFLLALCLLLALLPAPAFADEPEEPTIIASGACGDSAAYVLTSDEVLTITGTGAVKETPGVTRYGDDKLLKYRKLVIGEGITSVEDNAFEDNRFLREIEFPDSLTTIGDAAFRFCGELEIVSFGSGLKTVGAYAFWNDPLYGDLILPQSTETIGEYAFAATNLLSAVIYGNPGHESFGSNKKLQRAAVMNAEKLATEVFRSDPSLTEVYLADTIREIGENAFDDCTLLKTIRLPAKITKLPRALFFFCLSLETVIMPAVELIEPYVFQWCGNLREIYYAGTEAQLNAMEYYADGNEQLQSVRFYLLPGMPDPIFGFFDLPEMSNWAYEGIAFCLENEFMNGVGNGYFDPYGVTTRAQLVTILWRMSGEPKSAKKLPFTDCNISWANDAIAWAAENGIVNGVGGSRFDPNGAITREQLVTIFHRYCREYLEMDVSQTQSLKKFPDAKKVSSWAKDAMEWGTAVKLINGVGTPRGDELQPQGSADRAQIARVIMNFCVNVAPTADGE